MRVNNGFLHLGSGSKKTTIKHSSINKRLEIIQNNVVLSTLENEPDYDFKHQIELYESDQQKTYSTESITGTVVRENIEGGFYGIVRSVEHV